MAVSWLLGWPWRRNLLPGCWGTRVDTWHTNEDGSARESRVDSGHWVWAGWGPVGITAFTRYGHRAACGHWAAAKTPTLSKVSHLIRPGDWRLALGWATPTAPLRLASRDAAGEWGEALGGSQHHCKGETREWSPWEGAPSLSLPPSGLRKASREGTLSGYWGMNRSSVGGQNVLAWGSKHRGNGMRHKRSRYILVGEGM